MTFNGKWIRFAGLLSVVFLMSWSLVACSQQKKKKETKQQQTMHPQKEQVIKIGAILPLTGPAATFGQYVKEGMDLAVEEINKEAAVKLTIRYEDSKGQPKEAVSAFNKILSVDNPPVIIAALSSVASALRPLAAKNEVIEVYIDVAKPGVADGFNAFRIYPEANGTAGILADFAARNLSAHTAAVIYINDDYGQASLSIFSNKFVSYGGKIQMYDSYELLQHDFKSIITKLRNLHPAPDVIYLNGYGPAFVSLVKQIREFRLHSNVVADVALGLPDNLEKLQEAAEGIYFVDGDMSPIFITKFEKKYNKKPSSDAGYAYDAIRVLSLALEKQGPIDSSVFRNVLKNLKGFPGVMGEITMGPKGDASLKFVVKRIQHGVPITIQGAAK